MDSPINSKRSGACNEPSGAGTRPCQGVAASGRRSAVRLTQMACGSSSGKVTEVLEILVGSGEKPDRPNVYDARSVDINLRGAATS